MSKNYAVFVAACACFGVCGAMWAGQGQQASQPAPSFDLLIVRKLELRKLQNDGFGPDHPKVRAVKEEIDLIESYLKNDQPVVKQQQSAQPAFGQDALLQKKFELKKLLNDGLDANHPKVRALKAELEFMEELLATTQAPAKQQPSAEIGRFAVTVSPLGTVKLDTKTGESWFLRPAKAGEMEWVPIK